jgi:hypothetical protein
VIENAAWRYDGSLMLRGRAFCSLYSYHLSIGRFSRFTSNKTFAAEAAYL